MPKKTPETIRNKVVALKKQGASYTQIERNPETVNPETGQPLTRPTLIKILREAGLTRASAAAKTTPAQPLAQTPTATPSTLAASSSNGVDDFMPKTPKMKVVESLQCDQCGTEFTFEKGDTLPDICPECGG